MDFLAQNVNFILLLSGYINEITDTGAHNIRMMFMKCHIMI
jgi:hypothetical protein